MKPRRIPRYDPDTADMDMRDWESIAQEHAEERAERLAPWREHPYFDGTPHRGRVPDHLATGFVL